MAITNTTRGRDFAAGSPSGASVAAFGNYWNVELDRLYANDVELQALITALTPTVNNSVQLTGAQTVAGDKTWSDEQVYNGLATFNNPVSFTDSVDFSGTAIGAGYPRLAVFTSSGTWTVPAGITSALVTVIGAGGGGERRSIGGGGGGGGAVSIKNVSSLTPGADITVTVGSGGSGATTNNTAGGNGGASSFGAIVSCNGGAGGGASVAGYGGSHGAVGVDGDINYAYNSGGAAGTTYSNVSAFLGGRGGGPGGTEPYSTSYATESATMPGCGGGGGVFISATQYSGGDGADGIVIIRY